MDEPFLYPALKLDDELVRDLRALNPWWEGKPMRPLPATRRHLVRQIHRRLDARLAPIVVVRGPRQIGKTTAQLQVLADLLANGIDGRSILRLQADDLPALAGLKERFNRSRASSELHQGQTLSRVHISTGRRLLFCA